MSEVMVRPARTFLEGARLVGVGTDPYPVSRSRAIELRANGLVTFVEAEAAPVPAARPPEPAAETAAPKPTGRRPRAS